MSKLSFFKLPALFSISYFLLSMFVSNSFLYFSFEEAMRSNEYVLKMIFSLIVNNIFSDLFFCMSYFLIAILACYKYKLYRLNIRNILVMLSTSCLLYILSLAEAYWWLFIVTQYIVNILIEDNYAGADINSLITIINSIHLIIKVCILIPLIFLLFKLLSTFGKNNNQDFEFNATNNCSIYATLYTLLFYTPVFIFNGVFFSSLSSVFTINMGISPYLLGWGAIISTIVNLAFVYCSTRSCFSHVFPTLQIKRLFKSWGISVSLSLVFYLIVSVIFYLLIDQHIMIFFADSTQLDNFIILFITIFIIINYLSFYFINRFAVRRGFAN